MRTKFHAPMRNLMLASGVLWAVSAGASAASAQSNAGKAAPPHPLLRNETLPETLGVNIHFTSAKAGEMEMLVRGGFRWVRMDLTWRSTEREKGVYDFSAYDRLMSSLDSNKARPYFILDYSNALYSAQTPGQTIVESPNTPQYRAAFAKWAAAAVAHFKNRGVVWEIWNEPNIVNFWKPKPNVADYAALAIEATRAMRQVAPKECIIGPATSTIDLPFLEGCFQRGLLEQWDAISVHPYRQTAPETVSEELRQLRLLIERFKPKGKTIPVLSGEWGFSAAWNNFDADKQGKYLPRELLFNQMNEIPISIWYDWHNDGTDPKEGEHNFGTVEFAYQAGQADVYKPKSAYIAHKTMSDTLSGFRFNKRLWTGREDEYVLLFSRDNDVRLAVWTSDTKTTGEFALPASNGAFKRLSYLGQVLADASASNNQLKLSLSDRVQYLWPEKSNVMLQSVAKITRVPLESSVRAPIEAAIGGASMQQLLRDSAPLQVLVNMPVGGAKYQQQTQIRVSNPLRVAPLASAGNTLPVLVENPTGEAFNGSIRAIVNGQTFTQKVTLSAGQTETTAHIIANAPAETVRLSALSDRNRAVTSEVATRLQRIDNFARAAAADDYGIVPDGDAKVASTHNLSVANAPEPLLGQTVPALKFDYKWDAGWKFLRVVPPNTLKLEGNPRALQMWIYGDGGGQQARLRVRDSSGQTFQPNGVPIDWKGWKLVTWPLDGTKAAFWGGANDGKVHGALNWDTLFLLDSAGKNAAQGTIYLAQPTLISDVK